MMNAMNGFIDAIGQKFFFRIRLFRNSNRFANLFIFHT